jgi:hypothetical protein
MKIRPVGAELFDADGRTDIHTYITHTYIHDEANGRFCNFVNGPKKGHPFHHLKNKSMTSVFQAKCVMLFEVLRAMMKPNLLR